MTLYYALSQAGRAIVAAHADATPTPGHGLTANVDEPLLNTVVHPQGQREYQAVAAATKSPPLAGTVSLGALWKSLPDLISTPLKDFPAACAAAVEPLGGTLSLFPLSDDVDVAVNLGVLPEDAVSARQVLDQYPSAGDAEILLDEEGRPRIQLSETAYGVRGAIMLRWKAEGETFKERRRKLDEFAPTTAFPSLEGRRWWRPLLATVELWQHRRRSAFQGDDERVFAHLERGTVYRPEKFTPQFKAALKRAGITDHMRAFHDLRHTAITNDAASGSSPIAVMTKAGHSDMKTTKKYLHLAGVVFRDEAEALERRLLGVVSTDSSTDLSAPERISANGNARSEAVSDAAD